MKVWEIKTHRHGIRLVQAENLRAAVQAFEKWNAAELERTGKTHTEFYDHPYSCVCLGEVINP